MNIVSLGNDLGIEASQTVKDSLAPALQENAPILLDAGQVERVHAASLQVLCAFISHRQEEGLTTHIYKPSNCFKDAVVLLGIDWLNEIPADDALFASNGLSTTTPTVSN